MRVTNVTYTQKREAAAAAAAATMKTHRNRHRHTNTKQHCDLTIGLPVSTHGIHNNSNNQLMQTQTTLCDPTIWSPVSIHVKQRQQQR